MCHNGISLYANANGKYFGRCLYWFSEESFEINFCIFLETLNELVQEIKIIISRIILYN